MSIPEKFTKPYKPEEVEGRIYEIWEKSGYFDPDKLPGERLEPFTIIMPPPNANGSLHAGHAVFVTIEDLIIRFERMRGKRTLWLPGADHAGFETQTVYERQLEKEGRSRFGMDPQNLREEIMAFTLANKSVMEGQLRQLGASCDWSREKFTLDPDIIQIVYATFKKLYDDGLAYRGERSINWCTKHQTSLSELETITEERIDPLYYMKYGPFVLATVRPETKFGDTAVAVNPNDKRYQEWIGKEIEFDGLIGPTKLKVIADDYVDPEFGTGVVKITPAHDPNDFEVAKRHHLPVVEVIDQYGKLNEKCGKYAGLKVEEARTAIAEDLEKAGLLEKIDANYKHAVKKCYKCGRILEPRILPQWFIQAKTLAHPVIEAIEKEKITFYPDHYKKIILHWLQNIEDWNISRQIVWGIPIPAWYKGEEIHIGEEAPDEGWTKDTDTFDTWFSSGQWPFATLGYPESRDFNAFYPTQVMETGGDIVFFWVARMLMLGLYRTGELPFKTVYLHGLVRDAQKQKMSKSKGNVISPLEVAERFGTDALRMALIVGNTPGSDMALSDDKIKGYKLFANKIWNIARFILESGDSDAKSDKKEGRPPTPRKSEALYGATAAAPTNTTLIASDVELWQEFEKLEKEVTFDIEHFRFYLAGEKIYHYLWHCLADQILEESKSILKEAEQSLKQSRQLLLIRILKDSLKVLHPFMPFITEEIWQSLPSKDSKLLMTANWPSSDRG